MPNWIRSEADDRAAARGCYFDERAADKVCRFFVKFLRHSKGRWQGKPFELLDWQRQDIVCPLFGWKRPDGTRRFRHAYIELPKKNGKSTLASGIGVYMLAGDNEAGAEVYSAATDQRQASIVHGEAIAMVEASPELSAWLTINRSTKEIRHPSKQSVYRALSAGPRGSEGLNAHCIIIDELHAWLGRKLWDSLKFAFAARLQGLRFVITTAGDDMLSVCREQHDYAERILSGAEEDDRFFAYIRAADPADDWTSLETARKANPSLGITINEEEFAADIAEAQKSPTTQSAFKRYRLNLWATAVNAWLKIEDWLACRAEFTAEELANCECYGALDMASVEDLNALALIFRQPPGYRILPYFWLPEDSLHDKDRPEDYRVWARQGFLRATPGSASDPAAIEADIAELAKQFQIRQLAFDRWGSAEALTINCEKNLNIPRVLFAQTLTNFAAPTKELERLILRREIAHNNHPILNWMIGHTNVYTDPNGNMRPVKPKRGDRRKIDGVVATVMGLAGAMQAPPPSLVSQGIVAYV